MAKRRRTALLMGMGAALVALAIAAPHLLVGRSTYNPSLASNPVWDPNHRSAEAEARFEAEANGMSWTTTLTKLFTSEGNFLYQTYRDIQRKNASGPVDEEWRGSGHKDWIKAHNADLPAYGAWRFALTRNRTEAELLLADMLAQDRDAALLAVRFGLDR